MSPQVDFQPQTIVVKIGTSSLTQPQTGQLALSTIGALVETLTRLRTLGHRIILVSSGAVGVGCVRLGLTERPRAIAIKQAVAAVGQGRLMRVYDDLFTALQQPIAQVLLTRQDLVERSRYVNAYNTFRELLKLGAIPIVNENDTVAVEELKFGDNDTLSALVASLVEADWLFLLTDVDRLYWTDPNANPDAQPIDRVQHPDELLKVEAGTSSSGWGTGGMETKITAARIATGSSVRTVIAAGRQPENIAKILQGEPLGTLFDPQPSTDNARKRWIAYGLIASGTIYIDAGAEKAISQGGKSLLPAGIVKVEGNFQNADAVRVCNERDRLIARGITNYSSVELQKIQGCRSEQISDILGYFVAQTAIHRDNLVLI